MDLRIDAKKFRAATLSEISAYNQMGGCPTPPPSNGSIPRTPDSLSSCTVSRSSSLDDNTPSTFIPTKAAVQQKSDTNSRILAKIQEITSNHNQMKKTASSQILQKFNQLKDRNDMPPPLVFRPIDNYSQIGGNKFISIDKQEFHDNKRLRVQTEDDLLNDGNATKKFKQADIQNLAKTMKSAEENKFLTFILKSATRGTNFPSLTEVDTSLAWLGFLAKVQGQDEENAMLGSHPSKGELKRGGNTPESRGRFHELLEDFIKADFKFSSSLEDNTFLDFNLDKRLEQNVVTKPEEPTSSQSPKILQDSNGQLYVPLQHSIDLKKYQLQPVAFVTPVSDEKLESVPKSKLPHGVSDEMLKSVRKPVKPQGAANENLNGVHQNATPQCPNNILGQEVQKKYPVAKVITPPTIAAFKHEVGNKQTPALKLTTPAQPSKSKTIEQDFSERYPHLVSYKADFTAPTTTMTSLIAKKNEDEAEKKHSYPALQTSPIVKTDLVELARKYSLPSIQTGEISVHKSRTPPTSATKHEVVNRPTPNLPTPKPRIDVELASMLPHLASYNPDLFVPKLITDLTGRPIKQEFENKCNPNPIEPKPIVPEPPKTARQKLEAKFPLMAEYHRKCLIPKSKDQETLNKSNLVEPIPFPPRPITPPTTNPIGREVAQKYPHPAKHNPDLYVIGPNGSTISKAAWANINWTQTPAAITRKILMCLFDKYTLATHSLSGRPSPAFKGIYKTEKMPLHPGKVADTVSIVTSRVNVTPKEVRMAITTKCADECKMLRVRQEKKAKIDREFMANLELQPM